MDIKVEIYLDRMVISTESEVRTFLPKKPFSSVRLLVGDFIEAESCLRNALREMNVLGAFSLRKPRLLIHPKERLEGGLSEIEKRILVEVGRGAGAGRVEVVVHEKAV
ncbi:MAG TPA: hypothetical protein VGE69_01830 [Pseudomonadales bacterium]